MKGYKIVTRKFSIAVLAAAAIFCVVAPAKAAEEKPNIVFMLMDNLGYGELGVYGGGILRGAPTPRIDKLASEGMRLLNFNVEAQCTPSRSALMTGRFSIRSGTYKVPLGGIPDGLTLWEVTIAELLSARGYATGTWGKWHLGSAEARFPTHQGFDEWYGIPRTYDEAMWPSLNETNSMWPSVGNKQGWNSNVVPPEYIYEAHKDEKAREMDYRTGQILDAIKEAGIEENTIVIFASDNGPEATHPWEGESGPWRGTYFTAMEASLRAPFIIRWPGKIPAGAVSNEIVHIVDLYPTLARVGGAEVPGDRPIDGVDQLDFFLGKHEHSNREGFPAYVADRLSAVKWRNWKVHFIWQVNMYDPPLTLPLPKVINLLTDLKEERDGVPWTNSWVVAPVTKIVDEFSESLKKYPPIQLGTPDPYSPPR